MWPALVRRVAAADDLIPALRIVLMRPQSVSMVLALLMTPIVRAAPPPTFAHDIAPIVYEKCAPCHHPGEAAPFSLLTYEDVKKRAAQIATVTRSGLMPPWLPEHGYGDFADERRLTPNRSKPSPMGECRRARRSRR